MQSCYERGMCATKAGQCNNECEGARLEEEVRCVWAHVLDQQVEDHDCVCCSVAGRAGAGNGGIGLGVAAEVDD